jgi:hypothetical protein
MKGWGREPYKFEGTAEILDMIRDAEPTYGYVDSPPSNEAEYPVRAVTWTTNSPGYLVRIPAKNVLFMEGNNWYPGHAAALLEKIQNGENDVLRVPPARVYRVTASRVKESEKYDRANELSYQLNMTEPWTRAEQGEYYAQLLDGNHRAAAAILAGDQDIYVYVSENTRENVYKKDLE